MLGLRKNTIRRIGNGVNPKGTMAAAQSSSFWMLEVAPS
jgi:hypothetical protein